MNKKMVLGLWILSQIFSSCSLFINVEDSESSFVPSNYTLSTGPIGVNVSWFNTWNESQPLANVASTSRIANGTLPLDEENQPSGDMELVLYEGSNPGGDSGKDGSVTSGGGGGAQTGLHYGSFYGQADISISGAGISNVVYNSSSNRTTFQLLTTEPENTFITFANTTREPGDTAPTGIRDLKIMRPGHSEENLLNSAFAEAMTPFGAFRVGPNWDLTYQTDTPQWEDRDKPDGIFAQLNGNNDGEAPWEILASMANEMEKDLWICLPPNAEDPYLTRLFQLFLYGSDGVDPYTSYQSHPVWPPLDSEQSLYFEIGNEIWNWSYPYNAITQEMSNLAEAEYNAGDPYHYSYAGSSDEMRRMEHRLARRTAEISELCRSVVGDEEMMSRFRPVLSSQSAYPLRGQTALSYLKCVYGGYGWYTSWTDGQFPGMFNPDSMLTSEDGVSVNSFDNVAHPLNYWIYGYATAPYVNGGSISALHNDYLENVQGHISENIAFALSAGVVPLAYEGGIETYHSYNQSGLQEIIEEMLSHWYSEGGDLFMYYSLAGNEGSGVIPDLTRQNPEDWPKLKAIYRLSGM